MTGGSGGAEARRRVAETAIAATKLTQRSNEESMATSFGSRCRTLSIARAKPLKRQKTAAFAMVGRSWHAN